MYRDENAAATIRAAENRSEPASPVVPAGLTRTYAMRMARLGTAVFAAVILLLSGLLLALNPWWGFRWRMTYGLIAVWVLGGPAFAAIFWIARSKVRQRLSSLSKRYLTDSPALQRLMRQESGALPVWLGEQTERLERHSWLLPVTLIAVILPLTLHLIVGIVFYDRHYARDFDKWMLMSMALVGAAHLTVAIFSARHVILVQRELDAGKIPVGAKRGWVAMGLSVAAGCVPGALLIGIPPLIVAATGTVYLPLLFSQVARRMAHERDRVHSLIPTYPFGKTV